MQNIQAMMHVCADILVYVQPDGNRAAKWLVSWQKRIQILLKCPQIYRGHLRFIHIKRFVPGERPALSGRLWGVDGMGTSPAPDRGYRDAAQDPWVLGN